MSGLVRLTEFRRRTSQCEDRYILCSLSGSWSDESQWSYVGADWTEQELAPIEAVLAELMSPEANNRWCLSKNGSKYCARKMTWTGSILWADSPDELAERLRGYYQKYKS